MVRPSSQDLHNQLTKDIKGAILPTTERFIMSNTSLPEALSVNVKLGASLLTKGIGYTVGGFISIADTASNHAEANPDGIVHHALTTSIKDQYVESRDHGYELMEEAKDTVDFSKINKKSKG